MKPNLSHYFMSALTSALTLIAASNPACAANDKPNSVYIVADDLGWKDVGFNGASDIKTPNLDKLAATGARLEQFYAQPMCTPTRAALLTGRYPNRYGLQTIVIPSVSTYGLATDEWLLPQALKEAGYQTAIIGKWHLGHGDHKYWPKQRGFDYQYGPLIGELDYFTHEEHGVLDWYRDNKPVKECGYTTKLLGDDAVKYINKRNGGTPFFLYLAFNAPHTPYQAPQEYIDRYKNVEDPTRRVYAGMVACLDDQVGRVVEALNKKKLRDNTLIIFQSDNGGTRNAMFSGVMADMSKIKIPCDNGPYREGKGTLYEGGTRVCALVNWPGHIPAGIPVNEMIHVVDMYPTLAKLAGASTTKCKPLDGLDVWGTISDGKPSPRSEIVYNVEPFRAGIRQGDWKLIWRTLLPSSVELYNIAQDPSEKNNVAAEHPDKVAELQKRIEELAKASTKPLFLVEQFKAMQKGLQGEPALPNEDAYYEEEAP
jgi:Arylsulfatase A and related enzymes